MSLLIVDYVQEKAFLSTKSFRTGCSIKDENTVVLIGGYLDGVGDTSLVTRYDLTGLVETLPDLLTKRSGHACTNYRVSFTGNFNSSNNSPV